MTRLNAFYIVVTIIIVLALVMLAYGFAGWLISTDKENALCLSNGYDEAVRAGGETYCTSTVKQTVNIKTLEDGR